MKKHCWTTTIKGRAIRRAGAVLVAGVLLPLFASNGMAWAQQPAGKPAAAPATTQAPAASEVDPKAIEALKAMGAYLRTLKSFALHSDTTKDEVLDSGQTIQFTNTIDIQSKLPNRLRLEVNSDRIQRKIYYDGKTVTQYAPRLNYYATFDAPGTVRETLVAAADKFDLRLPLADLFFWGTDQSGIEDIKSAIEVGASRVGGVECTHYAFRQDGVDWQLWIERGKTPLPRKLVITTRDEPAHPQYMAVLRWDLKASMTDKTFAFVPPKGAQKITAAAVAAAK